MGPWEPSGEGNRGWEQAGPLRARQVEAGSIWSHSTLFPTHPSFPQAWRNTLGVQGRENLENLTFKS